MNVEIQNQLDELENLISDMDVPAFRRRKIQWLKKNLGIRNSDHPNFKEAMEIIKNLASQGVQ